MSALFDGVSAIARVAATALGDRMGSLLFDMVGFGFDDDPGDTKSETRDQQPGYSALGVLSRPPSVAASDDQGRSYPDPDLFLEALSMRASDGLIPFAFRDPRVLKWLNRGTSDPAQGVPKEGQTMFAGYGGGFLALDTLLEDNGPTNLIVMYCPYDRDSNGVPQKAHVITLDPTGGNESIAIVHASGVAITMTESEGIVMRGDAGTMLQVKPGVISAKATNIVLQGNVAVGANPAAALPLMAGMASQPCSSFFLSPG